MPTRFWGCAPVATAFFPPLIFRAHLSFLQAAGVDPKTSDLNREWTRMNANIGSGGNAAFRKIRF
jgi:hypothetical protein